MPTATISYQHTNGDLATYQGQSRVSYRLARRAALAEAYRACAARGETFDMSMASQ